MKPTVLLLPFPPSVNRLWRFARGRMYRTKVYVDWQGRCDDAVYEQVGHKDDFATITTPVSLELAVGAPDRRKRDLDNVNKAVLDLLQRVGVIEDDALVFRLLSYWSKDVENGVLITITPMGDS